MEQTGMVKFSNNQPYLCIDDDFLNDLYKKVGKPGKRVTARLRQPAAVIAGRGRRGQVTVCGACSRGRPARTGVLLTGNDKR